MLVEKANCAVVGPVRCRWEKGWTKGGHLNVSQAPDWRKQAPTSSYLRRPPSPADKNRNNGVLQHALCRKHEITHLITIRAISLRPGNAGVLVEGGYTFHPMRVMFGLIW